MSRPAETTILRPCWLSWTGPLALPHPLLRQALLRVVAATRSPGLLLNLALLLGSSNSSNMALCRPLAMQ